MAGEELKDNPDAQAAGCRALTALAVGDGHYHGQAATREAGAMVSATAAMSHFPADDVNTWDEDQRVAPRAAAVASRRTVQTDCQATLDALVTDPCADVNCGMGGACAFAECACEDGFCGPACEFSEGVLGPGAARTAGTCECIVGYSGDHCEHYNLCHGVDCGETTGQGFCKVHDGACMCVPGYSGEHCEVASGASLAGADHAQVCRPPLQILNFVVLDTDMLRVSEQIALLGSFACLALVVAAAAVDRRRSRSPQHSQLPDEPKADLDDTEEEVNEDTESSERSVLTASV